MITHLKLSSSQAHLTLTFLSFGLTKSSVHIGDMSNNIKSFYLFLNFQPRVS